MSISRKDHLQMEVVFSLACNLNNVQQNMKWGGEAQRTYILGKGLTPSPACRFQDSGELD